MLNKNTPKKNKLEYQGIEYIEMMTRKIAKRY